MSVRMWLCKRLIWAGRGLCVYALGQWPACGVPHSIPPYRSTDDPLSRMRAYQLAKELVEEVWTDSDKLRREPVAEKVASQLYAAVGSITANLAEGYSRSSGRDRSRIFEYALGSVRESMMWYHTAQPLLGVDVVRERLNKLEQVRRLLMAIIPRERGRTIRPRNG